MSRALQILAFAAVLVAQLAPASPKPVGEGGPPNGSSTRCRTSRARCP